MPGFAKPPGGIASQIDYTASGEVEAINVQDAIEELDLEKVSLIGGDIITASGTSVVPLGLKAASSQTANLLEVQNSSGTVIARIDKDGKFIGYGAITAYTSATRPGSPSEGQVIYETDTDQMMIYDGSTWKPVGGAANYQTSAPSNPQTGQIWIDSDATGSALNTNDYLLKTDGVKKVGGDTITAFDTNTVPLTLKGTSGQAVDLFDISDSSSSSVLKVSSIGNTGLGQSSSNVKLMVKSQSTTSSKYGINVVNSSGTDLFYVRDDGLIGAPSQISFLATRSANSAIGTNGITAPYDSVTYNSLCHNIGNCYNTSTYRFTAPISGRYVFMHNANVYNTTGVVFMVGIYINGSTLVLGTRFSTNIAGDNNASMSQIIKLSANDYVVPYIYVTSAMNISAGVTWSSFGGYLLG